MCFMLMMLMLVVGSMQRCTHPQAENGEHLTEGCVQRTCKSNIWRSSVVSNKCCFNREVYSINTTISSSMSEDGCAKVALDCVEETPGLVKAMLSVKNYCEDYATENQLEEIKEMLLEQMEEGSVCRQGKDVEAKYDKEEDNILLVGPDNNSDGKSEVLSLPDLIPLDCNVPVFPGGEYYGYVGRSTSDGVLMCGGKTSTGYTSSCYLLTSSGYQEMPGLIHKRQRAASVMTPSGLWVIGGYDGDQYLDTTEIWNNNQSRPHVRLPMAIYSHCLLSLNKTHSLLTGGTAGFFDSSAAFIYSEGNGFTRIEDMKTPRDDHGCSVINDSTVIVAGGYVRSVYSSSVEERSTEYLDLVSLTWSDGPELPKDVYHVLEARILGPEELGPDIGGHLLIGDNKIYKLEEGLAQTRGWTEVTETKYDMDFRQAFVVNQNMFCENQL